MKVSTLRSRIRKTSLWYFLKDQDASCFVVADLRLERYLRASAGSSRRKKALMEKFLWVEGGEKLKSWQGLEEFLSKHLGKFHGHSRRDLVLVSLGGGSVSDFVGFLASVYHRGVSCVHIPSTWLAAMDSVIGGKTALNWANMKNQLGSFHAAETVILDEELLLSQPHFLAQQAYGEVLKMALLAGGSLYRKVSTSPQISPQHLWNLLPRLIAEKQKWVQKDPFETRGVRELLNLGHSMGHIFELQLRISHGESVLMGLMFDLLAFSPSTILRPACWLNQDWALFGERLQRITDVSRLLRADKKHFGRGLLAYPVVKAPGDVRIVKTSSKDVVKQWKLLRKLDYQNLKF
ncbi:MAG: hypothetical protein WCH11_02040 [Bdellovibrio sp.]